MDSSNQLALRRNKGFTLKVIYWAATLFVALAIFISGLATPFLDTPTGRKKYGIFSQLKPLILRAGLILRKT